MEEMSTCCFRAERLFGEPFRGAAAPSAGRGLSNAGHLRLVMK